MEGVELQLGWGVGGGEGERDETTKSKRINPRGEVSRSERPMDSLQIVKKKKNDPLQKDFIKIQIKCKDGRHCTTHNGATRNR